MVYSTPGGKLRLSLHKAGIKLYSLPKNRCAATGCPLSAFRAVSGKALPFLTWCEMKTKSLLSHKVPLAFGSAILALLVVGAISFRGMLVSSESDRWVRHTHEVLEKLQDLLSAMQSIESSYRGFVLTGKESYLESYHASLLSLEQDETTVRNLMVDNPDQQGRLPALEDVQLERRGAGSR